MRALVLLGVMAFLGCGASLGERARAVAVAHAFEGAPVLDCGAGETTVEARTATEIWGRGGSMWPPPEGSEIDPQTGDVLSLPEEDARYFEAGCVNTSWCGGGPRVLVRCASDERGCVVVADNALWLLEVDCATY